MKVGKFVEKEREKEEESCLGQRNSCRRSDGIPNSS
jgi:hypothetical protein